MSLDFEIEDVAQKMYEKLKDIHPGNPLCDQFTLEKCRLLAPKVLKIQNLKKEKNAVILAHSYLLPDILYTVADYVGDSYFLAKKAQEVTQDNIIFAAVDFMAETAKILNPSKRVFKANDQGGCSLAESITGAQVGLLRKQYPEYTFVCYINTTAEVKAACDVVVTSGNVYKIIENLPSDKIIFLPDKLMAQNINSYLESKGSSRRVKFTSGVCYVHEQYEGKEIFLLKADHPQVKILAHPECTPEVVKSADFVGSTGAMLDYVKNSQDEEFFLMTECGLIGRVQAENPQKKFLGSCVLCKYMKGNSLEKISRVLEFPMHEDEVILSEDLISRAQESLKKMFFYSDN